MNRFVNILLLFFTISFVFSQDGTFDTTFSNDGVAIFSIPNFESRGNAILELSDSSYLIAGNSSNGSSQNRSFYIAKYSNQGDLDLTFGNNGMLFFPNGINGHSNFYGMLKQADGKILILGRINGQSVILRIDENGVYDSSFGINGRVNITAGYHLALQSNGKIIVSSDYNDGYYTMYVFRRYSNDGQIDISFGNGGSVFLNPSVNRFDVVHKMKVQSDDKIIVSGLSYTSIFPGRALVLRLNNDGALDVGFGNNGIILNDFGGGALDATFNDISIQSDGKIVACGGIYYAGGTGGFSGTKPIVVRYNPNGSFDKSFGNNGKIIFETTFNANDSFLNLIVQPNNKIILAGSASYSFPYMRTYFYLRRLNPLGSIDSTFGNNGVVLSNFTTANDNFSNYTRDFIMESSDKILAIGDVWANSTRQAFICRLNNDDTMNINENPLNNVISAYPNPTENKITLSNTYLIDYQDIWLYTILGQSLDITMELNNLREPVLDLSHLPNGIYILKGENFTKRIIKK